jgi:hypothetical protein
MSRGRFGFMHETLRLPLAWPFTEYGPFASGGVDLGNMNLEFVDARGSQFVATDPARVAGIAFEPATTINAAFGDRMDDRAIVHGPPEPRGAWTSMSFAGLLDADINVFAVDYHFARAQDAAARRKPLDDVRGGRLGAIGVREVAIGVANVETAQRRWQSFLSPAVPDADMRWTFGSGPALRLVAHERDEVIDLTLETRSADAADLLASSRADNDPLAGLPLTCAAR